MTALAFLPSKIRLWLGVLAIGLSSTLANATVATAPPGPPVNPLVLNDIPEIGRPGGDMRMLISRARDTRLLYVYGHARLVNWTPDLQLFADILASYDVEEGRIFTFHLREGHRWSDGAPFTTEDFRFYWEDMALQKKLSPTGPPVQMVVDGELPKIEIIDELTIRFTWSKPNPFFIPMIAAASPEFIYAPAHYLKQFHVRYAEPEALKRLVEQTNSRDWAQLFGRKERMNKVDNPALPTLDPWMLVTEPPADRFVAVRNPYFHRVDSQGQQLPYIDRIIMDVVDSKLVPIKTGAGDTDMQSRGLSFKDYTFLKDSEKRSGLKTLLWREARGSHLAIYPNLNASDPEWRKLFRDQRFRLALSKGLDRDAISQYLYFGLATAANNTVLEDSPLYTAEVGQACLGFDSAAANRLLDEMGLARRSGDGLRLLPDGRPMELVVETAGEDSEQTDVLELVRDSWLKLGFRIHAKPSEREVLRNRIFSGDALMTIWFGNENGVPTAANAPNEFVPTSQADQPQWPKWGQYFETKGQAGEAPDLPEAKLLMNLYDDWRMAPDDAKRAEAWAEILKTYASQCYTIGTVAGVMQPISMRANMKNVPEEAIYSWEPQAQIGIYRPDTFWYAQ